MPKLPEIPTDPDKLTLMELRVELKKIGLSPTGLKVQLAERMRKAVEQGLVVVKGKEGDILFDSN
jgi:hypothetical protein